ncbi:Uncharacterised protein [uncultured archaeon]|nr:Uncharacterised protein [uncultured archaeon]
MTIMGNVIVDSWDTYVDNIRLVLLFSIPFIIAFLIPLFAPLPTYITGGAIFLRSASVFLNINAVGLTVIIISTFLALLFLSFAFVAISLIVKAKRTHTGHASAVLRDVEKYTGRVFAILLIYAFVLMLVNMLGYFANLQEIVTPIVGFFLFFAIFFAPTAVVVENKRVVPAIRQSVRLMMKEPQYFVLWFLLIALVITVLDFAAIHVAGDLSSYVLLIINSVFVLPFFVIYQAEAYMRTFSLLKH